MSVAASQSESKAKTSAFPLQYRQSPTEGRDALVKQSTPVIIAARQQCIRLVRMHGVPICIMQPVNAKHLMVFGLVDIKVIMRPQRTV